jgi:hypothetical protein
MFTFDVNTMSTLSLKPPLLADPPVSIIVQVMIVPTSPFAPCTPFDLTETLIQSDVYGVYAAPDSSTLEITWLLVVKS